MLGLGRWRTATATPAPVAVEDAPQRPPSLLPTIKCSNCAIEIEISRLADHICSEVTAEPESYESPPPPPSKPVLRRADTMDSLQSNDRKSFGFLRPGKQPPKIDSAAANMPFARPPFAPPTPVSDHGNGRSASPMTMSAGRRPPMRSATSPMPRPYSPPSPEFSSNLDCAFPPFPTIQSRSNTPNGPRGRKQTDPGSRLAEPSPLYAPVSPRLDAGASVVRRMDGISPGPFDGRQGSMDRRPSTAMGDDSRAATFQAMQEKRASNGSGHARSRSVTSTHSKKSRDSKQSAAGPTLPSPVRPPRTSGDDESFEGIDSFLRRVRDEDVQHSARPPLNSGDRSNTFPSRKDSHAGADGPSSPLTRRPSEPLTRSRAQSSATISSMYSSDSVDAPPLPPMPSLNVLASFGVSKFGPTNTSEPQNFSTTAPPKASLNRPLHTPSDSASSGGSMSGFDARSASSASSVPGSEFSGPMRPFQKPSFGAQNFSRQRQGSNPVQEDVPAPLSPRSPPQSFGLQSGLGRMNAPANLSFPSPPTIPEAIEELPESPMDPAIQKGLISQQRPSLSNASGQNANSAAFPLPPPMPPSELGPSPALRTPPLGRKPTTGKKAKCRGCDEPIVGKSVKAADGRLTGRWHKECFTCKTCREPFQTADFYVHNNFPYCAHHYHQANDSLCQLCNRGIEGQFLETDRRKKYHPRCFMCSHCRVPLRDDYFEFNGRPYCERHAQHASSQNAMLGTGARRFPERRTTKLMMMM